MGLFDKLFGGSEPVAQTDASTVPSTAQTPEHTCENCESHDHTVHSGEVMTCSMCGAPITEGTTCPACTAKGM